MNLEPFEAVEKTEPLMKFRAFGTAVRAIGLVRPRRPFISDLSGQDSAQATDVMEMTDDLVAATKLDVNPTSAGRSRGSVLVSLVVNRRALKSVRLPGNLTT